MPPLYMPSKSGVKILGPWGRTQPYTSQNVYPYTGIWVYTGIYRYTVGQYTGIRRPLHIILCVHTCRWAVESLEACVHADWPAELLNDELGEEQRIAQPMPNRWGLFRAYFLLSFLLPSASSLPLLLFWIHTKRKHASSTPGSWPVQQQRQDCTSTMQVGAAKRCMLLFHKGPS